MYSRIPWEQVMDHFGPAERALGTTELDKCILFPHAMFL